MKDQAACTKYLEEHFDRHINELMDLLRIPSVSSLPEHQEDMRRAARWVAEKLQAIGVPTVEIMATAGNPVVYGEWIVAADKPTVLIYGHYDVQPPDPLDLWISPPFEPEIRDGRLWARGASDDKGNLFTSLMGIEALVQTQGEPPINIKFSFEGEEEIGSPNLPPFVSEHRDLLACDFVISADGSMWGEDTPSLTMGTKGIAGCQVNVRTAATDLHSGMYGATVPNAVRAAAQLAATFHDEDSRVAVAGFYDDVVALTDQDRRDFAEVPFDPDQYLADIGVTEFVGEAGYTPVERSWGRPTLDLNGIWGGFQGPGTKTVTPCEAHFKITCRLVANQDPQNILDLIEDHCQEHAPAGATVTIERGTIGGSRAFLINRNNPALVAAAEVLGDLYDRDPYLVRLGGTLPIAETYQHELGADMVFFAWGMPDSRVHAPNENQRISSFQIAPKAYCLYLSRLGELDKSAFA